MRGSDGGYFPRGTSVLRRVHEERVVGLLYGQRALLLQALHPLAFAGVVASTEGLDAPHARLVRTAKTMERVFYGSRAEADEVTARVRRMHSRVRGKLEAPAGPHPAGSEYSAEDPQFLLWVLACIADSALAVYERFVTPLTDDERELYWRDYLVVGELFGLRRNDAPASYVAFRSYMDERLASDELHLTDEARELALRVSFDMPLSLARRPALAAINLGIQGVLPTRVRRAYRITWTPAHELALAGLVLSGRLARPLTPERVRRGSCARDYDAVAAGEAKRLRRAGRAGLPRVA